MKYNSIGEQLIAKAQELDPSYKPDKFNDMSEALDVILNNSSRGYKIKKITITENGLYDREFEAYKPVVVQVPQVANSGSLKALLDGTKSAQYLFYQYKGTSVDGLIRYSDTANVTNTKYMFNACSNLTTIPQLDTSKVTNTAAMFEGCNNLTTIPQLDTSNVTMMGTMFKNCSKLTSVPELDARKCTDHIGMFIGCTSLKSIGMYGFTRSVDVDETALEHDAIVALLNQAGIAYASYSTISIGSAKLALLSDQEKAIATNKGWNLE